MVNKYARAKNLLKEKDHNLQGEDIREGITAIISVRLRDPQFEGQTKAKLGNTEIKTLVQKATNERLGDWFEENPTEANKIVKKAIAAAQARVAAKKARDVIRSKTLLDGAGMPDKLKDCSSKNREERELFIVEGDSAGGSAVTPAIPAPRRSSRSAGKILNVERARLDKMLKNLEVQALISAIGAGVGEEFDVEKRRYDKVCILADADVDGSHIRTLLLTFFFRQMKPLVEHGCVYICQPPLYSTEVGKEKVYLKDDHAKDAFLADNPNHKKDFARLKGLGEMDAEELQGHHHGPGAPHAAAGHRRAGRPRRRGHVDPHGRRRRGPQAVHRHQRQGRAVPRHLMARRRPAQTRRRARTTEDDDTPGPRPRRRSSPIEIQEEMERSFLDYAMSVITCAPARRPRRPEAGAPPDPLGHGRPRRPARPPT